MGSFYKRVAKRLQFNQDHYYITPTLTRIIAETYSRAPERDDDAVGPYRAMREEIKQQFELLTETMDVVVEVSAKDPYSSASEMMAEAETGKLRVYSTAAGDNPHPFFTDDENDMFRALHDYFGHFATGRGFDRHGEEAAFQAHGRMFSDYARLAVTTETRGQNAGLIQYGSFPEQKLIILPDPLTDLLYLPGSTSEHEAAKVQALYFHRREFGDSEPRETE